MKHTSILDKLEEALAPKTRVGTYKFSETKTISFTFQSKSNIPFLHCSTRTTISQFAEAVDVSAIVMSYMTYFLI